MCHCRTCQVYLDNYTQRHLKCQYITCANNIMSTQLWSCSVVFDLATPWTAAYQAPPSMGFSRQEYWSGLPLPSPIIYNTELLIQIWLKVKFVYKGTHVLNWICLLRTLSLILWNSTINLVTKPTISSDTLTTIY